MSKDSAEALARADYAHFLGKTVRVKAISGYRDDDNSHDIDCSDGFVTVRIDPTPDDCVVRWMDDEYLDPVYDVTIIERGGLSIDLRSCWIYGTTQTPSGPGEPGDIVSIIE